MIISISIDVTQLDKFRFKEVKRQNGQKAIFCDLVLIETPNGKYGDFICKQSQSKEDREARKETPILGNGKVLGQSGAKPQSRPAPAQKAKPAAEEDDGADVPF